jgi:hypothetical protein
MKYRTNLYLTLSNSAWIHKIFKKWAIIFQHVDKFHEISFV